MRNPWQKPSRRTLRCPDGFSNICPDSHALDFAQSKARGEWMAVLSWLCIAFSYE